MGHLHSISTF